MTAHPFRNALNRSRRAIPLAALALALLLAAAAGLLGAPGTSPVSAQGTRDYDTNDNNLIEVDSLAQLNAIRYDLNGNGLQDSVSANDWTLYGNAFDNHMTGMGCAATCIGYELMANLDFDTDGDGSTHTDGVGDEGDLPYYNAGAGWLPIGQDAAYSANTVAYSGAFNGNNYTISNLYINRNINNDLTSMQIGLFGYASARGFSNVGIINPYISITRSGTTLPGTFPNRFTNVGSLLGLILNQGSITGSWVDGGEVSYTYPDGGGVGSDAAIGCLVGRLFGNSNTNRIVIQSSGASCAVNASSTLNHVFNANLGPFPTSVTTADTNLIRAGGLVGFVGRYGNIIASYATGDVTCRGNGHKGCAGLTAQVVLGDIISSYATADVLNEAFFQVLRGATACYHQYPNNYTAGLTGKIEQDVRPTFSPPTNIEGDVYDSYAAGILTPTMARIYRCVDTRHNMQRIAPVLVNGLLALSEDEPGFISTAFNSYWNTETTGLDGSEAGIGKTTAELLEPMGYTGIYENWNRDLNSDGTPDDPWLFGTEAGYPILQYGHGAHSLALQRAVPLPEIEEEDDEEDEPGEYVAPPIVYNLNIRFSVKGITLDEGESATYQVRMTQPPVGHPARVRITSNNPDVVVSPTELTFSSADYNQWQRVKVTTLRDPNDTDESASLAHRGPNLGYGAIIVSVKDTWPGAATETVNGHTLTLRHTLDAPYGVTVTAPETLDADTDITIAGAPAGTPLGAPGYGLGATAAARMLAAIRVEGTPADGLTICLPVPEALLAEAGDRPLALLRYAEGRWAPVAGAARRDDAGGTATLCAAGVTEYGAFAVAYALPALGAVSDLAATAGESPGTITLTWTPGANAERHWVAGVKDSDRSKLAVWGAADAMGSHTVSDLEAGAAYIFTVTAGRGEGAAREWSAWATWATATAPAPTPTPTPAINPPNSPFPR